ncbi:saccharopine dehydrogenase (NAD+, L-lysine-forming) [Cognatiyoonia koreensis]|uniref:Saccharopine dehydrogenase [NAD(+), L-lysine-forming] n=1 Tax=Cognatiyoonia koreensis TaxID=364200 RepID=A0A1I0RV67_9RHOB|nr:saccharopine dehydrogenase [Cognatiyoonia koreensis]SEW45389.1 saccharopine dehydrogenase (NAD+, L-lysine-forming) [Cognatiyoonia koreensis]
MTHLWVRAEPRANEERVGITPQGAAQMIAAGFEVTVEDSRQRCIPLADYAAVGCATAAEGSWPTAPADAIIFGLKELPDDGMPLAHRHILFGHAYKGQPSGQVLLKRFCAGGGTLFDLEYLVDADGRRVAAFGYWAGFAGAAVAIQCWVAQQQGKIAGPVGTYPSAGHLIADLQTKLVQAGTNRPTALIIGALGRVGTGAADLCREMGVATTKWDMNETAHGGPFPEILGHDIFFNCILARPGTPVFVPQSAKIADRRLTVIGDIACDPDSDFSPIKVYDRTTTWDAPALRVHDNPPLDVTAIDNLPSMLPVESSEDYAAQLLPHLMTLDRIESGVWGRALEVFKRATAALTD